MSSQWLLLSTEIGLVVLAVACLLMDLFMPKSEERLRAILVTVNAGLAALLINLIFQWGFFGTLFGGGFVHDGLAHFFKVVCITAALFVINMTKDYLGQLKQGRGEFILLILFALIGMCFLVSANEFLLFFVALETVTVSLYINTAYLRDDENSIEAGIKFLLLGALSTAILVFGLSFVFGATGSLSFTGIQKALIDMPGLPIPFVFGMVLVIVALGFKLALVPFHFWAPDVYQGAPTPVTAYLAMASKAAALGGLTRLLMTVFSLSWETTALPLFLAGLSAITILYGNLAAIPQTNIKRLMAYSSIGHAGYLAMGLAAFHATGKEAILYYLAAYVVSTAGAFLVIVLVSNQVKSDQIRDYAGLSEKSPLLAAGMLLSMFSLAGMPPLAGFFGKFYVLSAAVGAGLGWLALIGVLSVIISLYYYLGVIKAMYLEKASTAWTISLTLPQRLVQYVSIAGIVFLGVYPGPLITWIQSVYLNFLQF